MNTSSAALEKAYQQAKSIYAEWGVDVDSALNVLKSIPISLHCWQGDDVGGFEHAADLGGGLAVTGNYPGRARNGDELRSDLEQAYRLIPGRHRLNLHAIYAETGGSKVDRDALSPEHFSRWMDWAKQIGIGVDFNPSYFAHPKASEGFTLTHRDEGIRRFWIDHGRASRQIAKAFAEKLGSPSVNNVWIPDGYKDTPVDRSGPRQRLEKSLDAIFSEKINTSLVLDSVEGKLFGIGSESYVVGSHEFYLGYAIRNKKLVCLDAGHYHPTEQMADKISSVLMSLDRILLHVSRGVRWDSDHVVTLNDDLLQISQELVRGNYLNRTHIGLDYFDASINRVAAWVIGTRNMIKALLIALLEPIQLLRQAEESGDHTRRLALLEEIKLLPAGAVWDYYCEQAGVPHGMKWLDEVRRYEQDVLSKR
ncbi:MAG: L-rhamnose isomerase [Phycisphaerae bacterium]|jgi:L-rhamnose isomerase|nr:MAG: L-rhamnose isomerase [Phycisphaerae bacterium]